MTKQKLDEFSCALLGSGIIFFLGALGMLNNVLGEHNDEIDRTGNKLICALFVSAPNVIVVGEAAK